MTYYRAIRMDKSFDSAVTAVREALAAQGFGVLSEIDVSSNLADMTGYEMEHYVILGACDPQLAQKALEIDRSYGTLLPCNVVVRGDRDAAMVYAVDPDSLVSISEVPALVPVAREATKKLDAAMATLDPPT